MYIRSGKGGGRPGSEARGKGIGKRALLYVYIGLKFWKVGSRKIYAVSSSELKRKGAADSSSDSDMEPPKSKRVLNCSEIEKNIKAIRNQIDSLMSLQGTLQIPLSLRKLLLDSFKCIICHNVIEPPVIYSRCCRRLLGCEQCIDTW